MEPVKNTVWRVKESVDIWQMGRPHSLYNIQSKGVHGVVGACCRIPTQSVEGRPVERIL